MPNEALVSRIKQILAIAKQGKVPEAYAEYAALFTSPEFLGYSVEDRRVAIKMVVNTRIPMSNPPAHLVTAYRASMRALEEAIGAAGEPADFELLGICCVVVGEEKRAGDLFRTGLRLERERNPQSDLCGSLMKWVAAV
jgi:hypothetical protein